MKVKDWREGIETSDIYLAIVSNNYLNDPQTIEHTLYAKNLNKPTIILLTDDTELAETDLFDGLEIIEVIPMQKSLKKTTKAIAKAIKKWRKDNNYPKKELEFITD